MAYLVNPTGRIVAVDNQESFEKWLNTPGFRAASEKEVDQYRKEKTAIVESQKKGLQDQIEKDLHPERRPSIDGIYLATVSQGGKDGYGIASAKMHDAIAKAGMPISFHNEGQKVGLLFHNPYSITNMDNDYLAIYTMFESDKIPDDWVYYLKYADLVIVPSKWCQQVFDKAGVKSVVIPLGYDENVFTYQKRHNKRQNKEIFTFLHYNAFNIRKGFREVFRAFTEEFEPTEPVKLVLKTTLERIPLPITKEKYPNIDIIRGSKYDSELVEIINKSDCLVFPSMGEGFGLTPLECMATGIPAIVPNQHGISEYFNDEYMYEVKASSKVPALYSRYKGVDVGKMVQCDVADLRKQMRYVYEHQEEALEKGKKASEYAKKWTIQNTATQLIEVLK